LRGIPPSAEDPSLALGTGSAIPLFRERPLRSDAVEERTRFSNDSLVERTPASERDCFAPTFATQSRGSQWRCFATAHWS